MTRLSRSTQILFGMLPGSGISPADTERPSMVAHVEHIKPPPTYVDWPGTVHTGRHMTGATPLQGISLTLNCPCNPLRPSSLSRFAWLKGDPFSSSSNAASSLQEVLCASPKLSAPPQSSVPGLLLPLLAQSPSPPTPNSVNWAARVPAIAIAHPWPVNSAMVCDMVVFTVHASEVV